MKNPSKHRSCPALGVDIPTSDCRALRNTSIACTADCPSNPFTVANCERLHAVERSVNATSLPIGLALPDEIVRVDLIEPGGRVANPGRFAAFLVQQALHVERDLDGKTRANRWIEAGLPGLETNDERALFRAIARMRIALMETRRVMDANRLEVVDLLRPGQGPFILMDPDHWRWAVRYGLSLARVFELPHFHRCAGRALSLPDFHGLESAWVAREVAMHLGWEPSGMAIGDWLMANQIDFLRSWLETRKACAADANKASQLRNCWAVYELRDSAGECHAAVHARRWIRHGSFQPGVMKGPAMAFFDWFDPCPGNPTRARLLARIYAGDHKWIIHSASEPVLAEARRQFEQAMGDRVAFADEETSELDGFPLAPATPDAAALIVPNVRASVGEARRLPGYVFAFDADGRWIDGDDSRAMLRRMAEDPTPLLDGKTPRAAAHDPALRPRLTLLLKSAIRCLDDRHLDEGTVCDSDWLLRELGAEELILPAPPVRPPPTKASDHESFN